MAIFWAIKDPPGPKGLTQLRRECQWKKVVTIRTVICNSKNTNKNAFQSKANCPLVLTLILVLKLDLDMVLIYHCAKKKAPIPFASNITARTGTDRQKHRHDKNITSPHMRAVIIIVTIIQGRIQGGPGGLDPPPLQLRHSPLHISQPKNNNNHNYNNIVYFIAVWYISFI